MPSMIRPNSSSGTSRGVFHGVGVLLPTLIMRCRSSIGTTIPSQSMNDRAPEALIASSTSG
jgi:hypothetical protein